MRFLTLAITITFFSGLVYADQPVLPSDSVIQQKMNEQRRALDNGLSQVNKLQIKPLVPSVQNLNIPDFMIQHGYGTLAREAQIEASRFQPPTRNRRSLMLALTLSMPEAVLQEYAKQAEESGARIILRGVPPGSSVPKVAALIAHLNHGAKAEWSIDPPLFRRFKITKVPALILVDDETAQKLENQCAPPASFLEVDGEVSIRQSLAVMARDHSNLGFIASKKLESIENGAKQ